jgi:hypothetical protein
MLYKLRTATLAVHLPAFHATMSNIISSATKKDSESKTGEPTFHILPHPAVSISFALSHSYDANLNP